CIPRAPRPTLFPYTTLFRSRRPQDRDVPQQRVGIHAELVREALELIGSGDESAALDLRHLGLVQTCRVREDGLTDLAVGAFELRSEEHTSELQSRVDLVCRI